MFSKENLKLFLSLFLAGLLIILLLDVTRRIIQTESPLDANITSRISFGERILVEKECAKIQKDKFQEFQQLKKEAVELINKKDYEEAINDFAKAKKYCPNAPETLIYLNNAKIGEQKSYTIATLIHPSVDYDHALAMLRGFAQAQWEINQQGGIKGIPVKLLVIDDGDNPEIAK